MGMHMSHMEAGDGFASKTLKLVMGTLYDQFLEKDIKDFGSFQLAILEMFNHVNEALPCKHYNLPLPDMTKLEKLFEEWRKQNNKNVLIDFLENHVKLNKPDDSVMITGLLAPPAAMVAKKTGQVLPQLRFIEPFPDVIFVPAATLVLLIAVKFSKIKLMKKVEKVAQPDK